MKIPENDPVFDWLKDIRIAQAVAGPRDLRAVEAHGLMVNAPTGAVYLTLVLQLFPPRKDPESSDGG